MRKYVLLSTAFVASLATVAPAYADFTIGIIAPLTGPGSADGSKVKSAMETAAGEINKYGGIGGEKLVLDFGDDNSDPLKSSAIAKDFLNRNVNFVIEAAVFDAPPATGVGESPADILALSGVQILYLTKTFPQINLIDGGRTSNLSSECYQADPRQAVIAANYVVKNLKDKKIAIVDDDTEYSKTLVGAFKTELNKRNVTEALKLSIDPGAYDHSQEAEKLKEGGVEVIYYGGHYPELNRLMQQLRQGPVIPEVVGGDALSNVNYQTSAKKDADGTVFTAAPRETLTTDLATARAALKANKIPDEDLTLRSYAAVNELAAGIRDELCYGHSEFSLITDIKDGRPAAIYLDPRAVAVRMSANEAISTEIDQATGNRSLPNFTSFVWKAGTIVPINDESRAN